MRRTAVLALAMLVAAAPLPAQRAADSTWSFVVVGHLRGDGPVLHPRLGELFDEILAVRPEAVVVAGDLIWGDWWTRPARVDSATREWDQLDSALATLGTRVWRVPGNHDVGDAVLAELYRARYGLPPQKQVVRGSRFLLLNSAWTPPPGDTAKALHTRGLPLDSAQVAWLRAELASTDRYDHTFMVMHHLLWWEADSAAWWREVHPLLREAGVRAVFTGDWGPLKFSHLRRDGIDYYQTSIGLEASLDMLRGRELSRVLEAQFDNFLHVTVTPSAIDVDVETLGETSSAVFTPAHFEAVHSYVPPRASRLERLWDVVGSPARLTAIALFAPFWFGIGRVTARRRARGGGG